MTYAWLGDEKISRQLGKLAQSDLADFVRVHQGLSEDPRSIWLRAMACAKDDLPGAWCVQFGHGGLLTYHIDDEKGELEPLQLDMPAPTDE